MRKEYGQSLRRVFTDALAQRLPDFSPARKTGGLASYPGERAFGRQREAGRTDWVVLVPDQKREAFTVEIGWSQLGRFPQLTMRPSARMPSDAAGETEYLCRLGMVSRGEEFWWEIEKIPMEVDADKMLAWLIEQSRPVAPDDARRRIVPLVGQAMDELIRYGMPFLERRPTPQR